jgi:hypothetical protein
MGSTQLGVCKPLAASNPMFGVRRLSLDRELNHGCRVTPNIGLIYNHQRPDSFIQSVPTTATRRTIIPRTSSIIAGIYFCCGIGLSGSIPRSIFAMRS